MSNSRPESHVAQQIRRDKLRIQNSQEFPNNIEQLSLHPGFNMDLVQVRNVRNANMLDEQAVYSSEVPNFSTASNPLSAPRNALEYQDEPSRLMMHQYGSFPHSSLVGLHSPQKEHLENWRNSAPQHQGCDWVVNYANSSLANGSTNTNTFLAAEPNNVDAYQQQMHPPSPIYQNTLQEIVKSASVMQQTGQGIWGGSNNASELELQYGNQPNQLRFGWTNRQIDNNTLNPLGFSDKKVYEHTGPFISDSNPQSLSLSLSSNAQSKAPVFEEGSASDDSQYLKHVKSIISRESGKSVQDHTVLKTSYRNVGPLGPFTGYATILKSSRFLKTAQQLLDEFCCSKFAKTCDVSERVSLSREVSASTSADTVTVNETTGVASKGSNSGSSSISSMLYMSKENSADWEKRSSFGVSSRPDYQQKKAKLLYMQEEVNRRYKQYHQQMQMVVASFESVAGLSSATPYISLAFKSVSKQFRCLNNSISDQLKVVSEVLVEDVSIPTTSTSSKVDTNMARLRCMDQSFQKNKSGRGSTGLIEAQQHVWRPQRGLPERSVAILRAWLFEHFLHPYPTDIDKQMLATQTGLSRNQVSNWFINARVRVWKPMVEEIHMLETKATGGNENEGASGTEGGTSQPRVDKSLSKFGMHTIPENQFHGMEMDSSIAVANNEEERGMLNAEQWSQEKRSKLECQMSSNMDGTLMSFLPCRHGGLEVGGLGSVSLTLGLRHGVEGVQHQQQQLQEEQLRCHLGGQMIHDFVG